MQRIESLAGTDIETVHRAFVEAFSDYDVRIDLPLWKFQRMLRRRGYDPELSLGAFDGEALTGFILNAYGLFEGIPTVYDVGTGVRPAYRRRGITASLFEVAREAMQARGAERYLLEVLKSNSGARELYEKKGFRVRRSLSCYRGAPEQVRGARPATDISVEEEAPFDAEKWKEVSSFMDCAPSWQNSPASIDRDPESFRYAVVRRDGRILGFGIADRETGDLPLLAVDSSSRSRGIGTALLADLARSLSCPAMGALNLDDDVSGPQAFLRAAGFAFEVGQYEMELDLL